MKEILRSSMLALVLLAGCGSSYVDIPLIETRDYPDGLPPRIISNLSKDAQAQVRRGLTRIDSQLSGVCTPEELAVIKESFVIFAWITASQRPDLVVQTYVDARAPVLRRAREELNPACATRLDEEIKRIRNTHRRGLS